MTEMSYYPIINLKKQLIDRARAEKKKQVENIARAQVSLKQRAQLEQIIAERAASANKLINDFIESLNHEANRPSDVRSPYAPENLASENLTAGDILVALTSQSLNTSPAPSILEYKKVLLNNIANSARNNLPYNALLKSIKIWNNLYKPDPSGSLGNSRTKHGGIQTRKARRSHKAHRSRARRNRKARRSKARRNRKARRSKARRSRKARRSKARRSRKAHRSRPRRSKAHRSRIKKGGGREYIISINEELIEDLGNTNSILDKQRNQLSNDDYITYYTYLTNIQNNALGRQMMLASQKGKSPLKHMFFDTQNIAIELEADRRRHRKIRNILEKIQAQSQQTTEGSTMIERLATAVANTVANTLAGPAKGLTDRLTEAVPDGLFGT